MNAVRKIEVGAVVAFVLAGTLTGKVLAAGLHDAGGPLLKANDASQPALKVVATRHETGARGTVHKAADGAYTAAQATMGTHSQGALGPVWKANDDASAYGPEEALTRHADGAAGPVWKASDEAYSVPVGGATLHGTAAIGAPAKANAAAKGIVGQAGTSTHVNGAMGKVWKAADGAY